MVRQVRVLAFDLLKLAITASTYESAELDFQKIAQNLGELHFRFFELTGAAYVVAARRKIAFLKGTG